MIQQRTAAVRLELVERPFEKPPIPKWAEALNVVDAAAAALKGDKTSAATAPAVNNEPFEKVIDQLMEQLAASDQRVQALSRQLQASEARMQEMVARVEEAVAQRKAAERRAEAAEAREQKMAGQMKMAQMVVEELQTADARIRTLEKRLAEVGVHSHETTSMISQLKSAQELAEARALQAEERARESEQWLERLYSAVVDKLSTKTAVLPAAPANKVEPLNPARLRTSA
jgi:chromosome segregation ATPase